MKYPSLILTIILLLLLQPLSRAETRSERKARERAESEAPAQVHGGRLISIAMPYDDVYDSALTYLKKTGYVLDTASKETGQITTAIAIKGGWKQQGRRVILTVIKEGENASSLRAVVTLQKRYKAIQVEPWSDPVLDEESSEALQTALQHVFLPNE